MTTSQGIFLLCLVSGVAFFSYNAQRLVRYLRIARPASRLDNLPRRIWNLLSIGFAQTKIFRDPVAGPLHALVFWGFLILQIGAIEILIQLLKSRSLTEDEKEAILTAIGVLGWSSLAESNLKARRNKQAQQSGRASRR